MSCSKTGICHLPDRLVRRAYASLYLDLDEALTWVRTVDNVQ